MKYLITGSTGGFGSSAINKLLEWDIPAKSIVALARSLDKAKELVNKGVDVRVGDYNNKESLLNALDGVDRVLLVSGSEVGNRFNQHKNVIDAAKVKGVSQIIYTSITRALTSENILAPEHKATEEYLTKSGINYTILRNNWYLDNYIGDLLGAKATGVIESATNGGRISSALRSEYAEAAVSVLTGSGHDNKVYELSGKPWTLPELALAAAKVLNKEVTYNEVSFEKRKQNLLDAGLDDGTAGFYAVLDQNIESGTLDIESTDLEELLDRKPLTLEEGVKALLS